MENSFRATTLAFLDEWSLFAERNGVDLIKVINAIKMRPTHNNMIFPGPGIGGYCLPKDGGLGYWAYKHILGFEDDIFKMSTTAIDVNDTRALHVAELDARCPAQYGQNNGRSKVLLCGASYRARCRGHAIQRLGNGGAKADRDGCGAQCSRPLRRPLV